MRINKRKGKIGNKIIVLAIIAIIVALASAGSMYNRTNQATTTIAKDGTTQFPFTSDQLVKSVLQVAMNGYTYKDNNVGFFRKDVHYYHFDCSTTVATALENVGATLPTGYQYNTTAWENGSMRITYNGTTYTPTLVMQGDAQGDSTKAWYDVIDKTQLVPGDIIVGTGHMFMYVGQADNLAGILAQLSTVYGSTIETTQNKSNVEEGKLNYLVDGDNVSGNYWYIEGNLGTSNSPLGTGPISGGTQANVNRPYLRNYIWNSTQNSKTMSPVRVYRITSAPTYTGKVGLYKYEDSNNNGQWDNGEPALQGAKFKIAETADKARRGEFVKNSGNADYEVTTDESGKAVFEGFDLGTSTSATYYIVETDTPDDYDIIDGPIEVTVKADGYDMSDISTLVQIGNKKITGNFIFKITKQNSQTSQGIPGAKFKISIKNNVTNTYLVDSNGRTMDGSAEYGTNGSGVANFSFNSIEATTYSVVISETTVPTGYTGIAGNVSFNVEARLNESVDPAVYELIPSTPTVQYAKSVEVTKNQVAVVVENTPITYTGKVGLYKYEDKNRNDRWDEVEPALQGAKFKIAETEQKAINGEFIKDSNNNDYEVTTGADGKAVFEGLNLGTSTQKTYYIVETVSPTGFNKIKNPVSVIAKSTGIDMSNISTLVQLGNKKTIYDLALRKYITAVTDGKSGETADVTNRAPKVTITEDFKTGKATTAKYEHTKEPMLVHTSDIVTYTIRIYNEGTEDAYANIIKDDIPAGLEFVQYTEGDGSINDKYGWTLVDENDSAVTDPSKAKYIVSSYLDKDARGTHLLRGYNQSTMSEFATDFVQVQFKVTEPTTSDRILTDHAQISKETDSSGNIVKDRDSTPNEWLDEDDEDIEPVKVMYFDLALRKWVTEAWVIENGNKAVYLTGHKAEDDPEEVVKVDLKKSKINDVIVKFKYSIKVTNQGQIAGEALEVRDDVPAGLKFVEEDNPDWKVVDGKVITTKLANTTLQPGESAEVEIVLTWINGKDNMGVKVNVAEINKDHNDYGTPDIDSTPGNNVPKEDDIDDAPVMLSVTTGSDIVKYVAFIAVILTFIGISIYAIKRRVLSRQRY